MRWLNLLFAIAVNLVPIVGALVFSWSVSTILVLYWFENLLLVVATSLRILLHRRWTRRRGHWMGVPENTGPEAGRHANMYLAQYAIMATIFTVAHGIFVAALASSMTRHHPGDPVWQFSLAQFESGALSICALLSIDLIVELGALRRRSFAWLKAWVDQRERRVYVLQVAIIFGMLGLVALRTPLALLCVLMALKTVADVASVWTRTRAASPAASEVAATGGDELARREQVLPK